MTFSDVKKNPGPETVPVDASPTLREEAKTPTAKDTTTEKQRYSPGELGLVPPTTDDEAPL
jgi:hypothetical protein